MPMPDFLVVGAPKAGSTALHAALEQHPSLFLSNPKEPKFFMTGGTPPRLAQHRGPGDAHSRQEWVWQRERYEALFADAPAGALRGESTPFYLWDTAAHRRIAAAIPQVKMIAVIRDPIDRAYSNWVHMRSDGLESEADFLTACNLEAARAASGYAPFWRYLGLGRYGEQLRDLYEHFPREQVHVVRYRELVDTPVETLDRISDFLGVRSGLLDAVPGSNTHSWAGSGRLNTGLRAVVRGGAAVGGFVPPSWWRLASRPVLAALQRGNTRRPKLETAVRRQLVERIADDVQVLETLLGRSFQDWLGDSGLGDFAVRSSLAPSTRDASQ